MNIQRIVWVTLAACALLTTTACGEEAEPVDIAITVDGSRLEVTGLESEQEQDGDDAVGDYTIETDNGTFLVGLTAPGVELPAGDDLSDPETFTRVNISWTDDDDVTWSNSLDAPVGGAIAWDPTGAQKTVLDYDGPLSDGSGNTVDARVLITLQEE